MSTKISIGCVLKYTSIKDELDHYWMCIKSKTLNNEIINIGLTTEDLNKNIDEYPNGINKVDVTINNEIKTFYYPWQDLLTDNDIRKRSLTDIETVFNILSVEDMLKINNMINNCDYYKYNVCSIVNDNNGLKYSTEKYNYCIGMVIKNNITKHAKYFIILDDPEYDEMDVLDGFYYTKDGQFNSDKLYFDYAKNIFVVGYLKPEYYSIFKLASISNNCISFKTDKPEEYITFLKDQK